MLVAPWGQVTCRASQSMLKAAWAQGGLLAGAAAGLGGVGADWPEQGDPVVVAGGEDVAGADVASVDRVLAGHQPAGEALVDSLGHLGVVHGRAGGLHVRDQVGRVRLAGLREVDLVARPAGSALDAVAGVKVIRGGQPLSAWREVLALPPAHLLPVPVVLLVPGLAQGPDRRDLRQPFRGPGRADGVQQREAVPAGLPEPPGPGVFPLGEAIGVDPGAVAVRPLRADQPGKPAGSGCSQGFQRSPQRLADEFHPVQRAHRRQHVRGAGPLPPAGTQQPGTRQPRQHYLQHPLLQPVPDEARAEVPQDGVVEAGIIQLQAEEELPVHPGPHLVSGLPVRQPLRELKHRYQRQGTRRGRRAATPRKRRGKVLVRQQRTERLTDPDGQGPLRERGPHHPGRHLRHAVVRPQVQRHRAPSSSSTIRSLSRLTMTICPEGAFTNGVLKDRACARPPGSSR